MEEKFGLESEEGHGTTIFFTLPYELDEAGGLGMKYVEQLKSFVLLFLVSLSLVLTFLIWNYKPTL